MQHEFWHNIWNENNIGFHEGRPNALLERHINALQLKEGARIFLPLCGKTLDIAYLCSLGYKVVGAELNRKAIEQLFEESKLEPKPKLQITELEDLVLYSTDMLEVYVGDIFNLSKEILGEVDAVYDRAALVALPDQMRQQYTQHLMAVTAQAKQLLITFDYDQSEMDGPPFSIPQDEITRHYSDKYEISLLESKPFPGKLRDICEAIEEIRLLSPFV